MRFFNLFSIFSSLYELRPRFDDKRGADWAFTSGAISIETDGEKNKQLYSLLICPYCDNGRYVKEELERITP